MREEMEVTAEFEMSIDLDLREPEPVSEETLDLHADAVTEALERGAAQIALGLVVSLDVLNSTIGLRFDLLGDADAEIYENLAEVIRVIRRKTGLPLRVARVEVKPISAEDWADLARFLNACDEAAA